MEKRNFISACKAFFGFKQGQDLKGFSEEIKALTLKDRQELAAMFPSVGYEINPESIAPPTVQTAS